MGVSDNDNELVPHRFSSEQNYPNPFNPTTKIRYTVPSVSTSLMKFIQFKINNILGNEVATLINEEKPTGEYEVEFDGNDFISGIYFYQLKPGPYSETRKMTMMK